MALLPMAALILVIGLGAQAQDSETQLEIDAAEIKSETGTELLADNATLKFGNIRLHAPKLRYDVEGGWAEGSDGITLTDGDGNKLTAGTLEYFPILASAVARGQVLFEGNSGLQLVADLIRFELKTNNLLGEGNIVLRDGRGSKLSTSEISYNLDAKEGAAKNVVITGENHPGQITAGEVKIAPFGYRLIDATYTTCHMDDPDWILSAQTFTVDERKVVTARNATLRVFGVPVVYLPELSFINSDERRSGFLSPKFIYKSGSEFSIETPVYLNLAPNYDATVSPRYTFGRGIYTEVSGRWLFPNSTGSALLGHTKDQRLEDNRGRLALESSFQVSDHLRMEVEGEWVSDDSFPDDFLFGSKTAQRHFAKRIEVIHLEGETTIGAKLLKFQTIREDNEVASPYDSLPGVYLRWRREGPQMGGALDSSLDYFARGDDDPNEGLRTHTHALVTRTDWLGNSRLDSEFGVAGSIYSANDSHWATSYASLQLRKPFSSDLLLDGDSRQLVIEPRLALGLVSGTDFEDVPLYDTDRAESSADELYNVNSFNGHDRFEDTNLLAYGFSMRMPGENGPADSFSALIAQRYRFNDSKIQANSSKDPPKRGFSNLILEGKVKATSTNTVKGRVEWNPDLEKFEQLDVEAQLLPSNGNAYSLHYAKNLAEGVDESDTVTNLSIYQKLGGKWQVLGDVTYDFDDSRISKVQSGLRYISSCRCWNMDIFAEREPLAGDKRTYFFFQLNLLGLGALGTDRFEDSVAQLKEEI